MGLFRPDRGRRGSDPFLPHKMLLFVIGASCAIAGMISERAWLVNVGIIALLGGVLLRVVAARRD